MKYPLWLIFMLLSIIQELVYFIHFYYGIFRCNVLYIYICMYVVCMCMYMHICVYSNRFLTLLSKLIACLLLKFSYCSMSSLKSTSLLFISLISLPSLLLHLLPHSCLSSSLLTVPFIFTSSHHVYTNT